MVTKQTESILAEPMAPVFVLPYGPKPKDDIYFNDPSLTEQQFASECDINTIIKTFHATGQLPAGNNLQPTFSDLTNATDFNDAMNLVIQAEEMFMDLPAKVRDRFDNDPIQLLQFIDNEDNRAEAIELGLVAAAPRGERSHEAGEAPKGPAPVSGATLPDDVMNALRGHFSASTGVPKEGA